MDVKALILVGGREDGPSCERLGGVPFALLDVLGEPVVGRVMKQLKRVGVSGAAVVCDASPAANTLSRGLLCPDVAWSHGSGAQFWRAAENAFSDLAQSGAELVLVVRIGRYAEIDYEELIQCHIDRQNRVTSASDENGEPLDIFVINASRRNDAAYLFRHELQEFRDQPEQCKVAGYVNRLEHAADFRKLALDGIAGIAKLRPVGTEIKPGVWKGEGARIHRTARLLAPAFIGAHCRIRALSVITRGSVIEHHSAVDCGTVIENSTVLPYTAVGAGLDVVQSVVGLQRIANLRRKVEIEVVDTKLIGAISSAPLRVLSSAAELALFLPRSIVRGVWPKRPAPATLPEALSIPSAALKAPELENDAADKGEFSPNLIVARRYGNE